MSVPCHKTSVCNDGPVVPWYEPIDPKSRTALMCHDCAAQLNRMGSDFREDRRRRSVAVENDRRRSFVPVWLRRQQRAKDLTNVA
jgi:hypothetical protein